MKKILILLFCFYTTNAFAFLKARLDTVSVQESGVFQLELQTNTDVKDMPDLTQLQEDFEIVGQGNSQSYQFDGKNHTVQRSLILNLMPKKTGLLTIPEITWGKEKTNSLQIEVKPDSDTLQVENENALIIEAGPLSNKTYQGAGLIYRVQVFERIGLIEGTFYPPVLADAEIIPLGKYTLSQEKKDGVLYQVLTQDYIIFPQKAGDDLTIEPAKFQGYYRRQRSTDELLPFGFTDSFIYQPRTSIRKEISVKAKPVQITVLPQPENTKIHWWLPASDVTLDETWTLPEDNIKVGDSITRQIKLNAVGVLSNMLPDITVANGDDFKVYPEEAQKSEFYDPKIGLVGQETKTFAFIPLYAGRVTLPAVSVSWFDVNEGKTKTTTLPAKTFVVAENPQYAQMKKPTPKQQTTPKDAEPMQSPEPFQKENNLLYFMSGLCAGLALGVVVIILLHQKHSHKKKLPELYPHEK